jgi:D-beta-D-heptose 7-phosphate kinase / D-beta-D-heptose 1-phosphate adenosyltransferase
MFRVDREQRHALSGTLQRQLAALVMEQLPHVQALLISDYAKGVATPFLLAEAIAAAQGHHVQVLIDPGRNGDYMRYRGATLLSPNRAEMELATGRPVRSPSDALQSGDELRQRCQLDAVLVKLDSDGMALVRAGETGRLFPTRPRAVYDVTGAGDMVLAMTGLCRSQGVGWDETVALANVAAGLEVERLGVAPVTRAEIRADLVRAGRGTRQKLVELADLLTQMADHRRRGRKIVFTNGCFDLLHVGHVTYLEEAALLGDVLVVAVNSDRSVRQLKGPQRPVVGQAARAALVAALACVDHVIVFDEDTPRELLCRVCPDVLVKGGTYTVDQVIGKEIVESYGGKVCVVGTVDGVSTTNLLASMKTTSGVY